MLKTILVTGGNFEIRQTEINKIIKEQSGLSINASHPDLFLIRGVSSISIEQIRQLKTQLTRKPYQAKVKIAVILEADKMTIPAQNAFLKTLEETPVNSLIILATPTPEHLLPTVLSRCQSITFVKIPEVVLFKPESTTLIKLYSTLPKVSVGAKLLEISEYTTNKEVASGFVLKMIEIGRNLLKTNPSILAAKNLRLWQRTYRILSANVNPHLALGNLFLLLS